MAILGIPVYIVNLTSAIRHNNKNWKMSLFPILADRFEQSGVASGHYFHQDLWAARRIYSKSPNCHVDVGSRVDGFIAHLLTFRDVTVIDVRSLQSKVADLKFVQANMMDTTSVPPIRADSVSSLHAIEHFGLGRYGDPFDWDGWEKGILNLTTLLLPGGHLYLSVPVGRERVEFNAHRVFRPKTIIQTANEVGLALVEFSYIDDAGDFYQAVPPETADACEYGCGCFEFVRANDVELSR